jgi:hypothetical protein
MGKATRCGALTKYSRLCERAHRARHQLEPLRGAVESSEKSHKHWRGEGVDRLTTPLLR